MQEMVVHEEHGAITIPLVEANERGPQWLRSLNVTAVTQIDQVAQIAPLLMRNESRLCPPRLKPGTE